MKKSTYFGLIALVLMMSTIFMSCQKTEVYNDELSTDVVFRPMVKEDVTINKSYVNREVLGSDPIVFSISDMKIEAMHLSTGYQTRGLFDITDDGDGLNEFRLVNVPIGLNLFTATTNSYINPSLNRFSYNNQINNSAPFSNCVITTTEELVNCLRTIPPYVTFVGSVEQDVTYNSCETECNEVEIDMKAQQGRLIVTVEFENEELLEYYLAETILTADKTSGNIHIQKDHSFAWFYISHEEVNDLLHVYIEINLKGKIGNEIINTWSLDSDVDDIAAVNGKDRWIKIVIKEDAIKSTCVDFKFNWEWAIEDSYIGLD